MIDFTTLQGLTIPEGVVTQITDESGRVIWAVMTDKPIVLKVEKITSNTYVGGTAYTAEKFILFDIYPKTNGTVKITYGDLTKTITDTSGAEKPNAQQVFFGTYGGVTDSVPTPASDELIIEGDYYAFAESNYQTQKMAGGARCRATVEIVSMGNVTEIPSDAFGCMLGVGSAMTANTKLTKVIIPHSVTAIGNYAFANCTSLTNVTVLATTPPSQSVAVFENTTCIITVPKGCGSAYKAAYGWATYADRIEEAS